MGLLRIISLLCALAENCHAFFGAAELSHSTSVNIGNNQAMLSGRNAAVLKVGTINISHLITLLSV